MAAGNDQSPPKPDVIRVFVADSTLMGNELLACALERDPRFHIVGTADKPDDVLAGLRNLVDVAVIGASLGGADAGTRLARRSLASYPGLAVVMLLECQDREAIVEAFRAGATGVFCRTEPVEVLCNCIGNVHHGKVWARNEDLKFVLEALASSPLPPTSARREACILSEREQRIIRLVAEGLTNRQIAAELSLNEHTLKSCLQRLFEKLDVSGRTELVFAASMGAARELDPIALEERGTCLSNEEARYDSYSRAAEHGFPFAQLAAGKMCLEGQGTTPNLTAAYAWFLLAEDSANTIAMSSQALRESLAAMMSEEQLADAEQKASEWRREYQLAGQSSVPMKDAPNSQSSYRKSARQAKAALIA